MEKTDYKVNVSDTLLKIRNISFSFENTPILKNITASFQKSEIISFSGNSGVGKSSFAQILAGFLKPQKGQCLINGIPVTSPSRKVFLVHQSLDLFPWQNVEKHLEFASQKNTLEQKKILRLFNLIEKKHITLNSFLGECKSVLHSLVQ